MLHSLAAQVSHYREIIQRNAEWNYAGVFADEALTGTRDNRPEFQRLIADCRAGHVDLILTKSVSRFARNTVDALSTIRKLKEKGVEVFFEKENIYTLDTKGELLITIMNSTQPFAICLRARWKRCSRPNWTSTWGMKSTTRE